MVNQSGTRHAGRPGASSEYWGDQMRDGLLQGFDRAYDGNRAPLIIGNHFESWNGGTYMRAVEETIERSARKRDVRCVSFRQLADWLDAQDPQLAAPHLRLERPRAAGDRRRRRPEGGPGRPSARPGRPGPTGPRAAGRAEAGRARTSATSGRAGAERLDRLTGGGRALAEHETGVDLRRPGRPRSSRSPSSPRSSGGSAPSGACSAPSRAARTRRRRPSCSGLQRAPVVLLQRPRSAAGGPSPWRAPSPSGRPSTSRSSPDLRAQEVDVVLALHLVADDLQRDAEVPGVLLVLAVDGDALAGRLGDQERHVEAGEHAGGEGVASPRSCRRPRYSSRPSTRWFRQSSTAPILEW